MRIPRGSNLVLKRKVHLRGLKRWYLEPAKAGFVFQNGVSTPFILPTRRMLSETAA